MKNRILSLCSKFYWKVRFAIQKRVQYNYYLGVFDTISKIKDIKTNFLTKKQNLEIDNFYKRYCGTKVPYMWHNLMVSYNNKFDVRYLPPKIFLEIIDKLNSQDIKYFVFYDKNFLYNFVTRKNIKVPKRLFYSVNGLFFNSNDDIISKEDLCKQLSNIGEVFIKPTKLSNSGYSQNCRLINVSDGTDTYSNMNIKDMLEQYYNNDFVVQEKVACHKSISDIYSKSVNTFSLYSIILNNDIKIINKPIFKIGMNGNITDYSGVKTDGLIIAMTDDGMLHDSALCVKQNKWYTSHPDTKFVFKDYKIENFHKVLESVKKLHSCIPWLKFCKWDVTIDIDGEPVLVELERPSELFPQQVLYKEGIFGEYTEELLSLLKK